MKSKIEIYILSALIVILSLYIVLRDNKSINYEIPTLERFSESEITKIEYNSLTITNSDGKWFLPSGYEAQESKVDRIRKDAANLKLIDMISDSKDYSRFNLDSPDTLKIFKNDQILLELMVGDSSSTGNYTYVKVPGRDEVYSVRGDIKGTYNKEEGELRNKRVLTINSEKVTEIKITKNSETLTVSGDQVTEVLNRIKNLEALNFNNLDRENELINIEIVGDEIKTLTIFENVGEEYPALSSDVSFPFTLPGWLVDSLLTIQ